MLVSWAMPTAMPTTAYCGGSTSYFFLASISCADFAQVWVDWYSTSSIEHSCVALRRMVKVGDLVDTANLPDTSKPRMKEALRVLGYEEDER